MPTIADKRRTFRKLHETGCFVIPNPWDIGSARYLQHLGFKALATTSAGFAFTRALPDGGVVAVQRTFETSFQRIASRVTATPAPTCGVETPASTASAKSRRTTAAARNAPAS